MGILRLIVGSVLGQIEPSFCWKEKKDPKCPSGYNQKALACQEDCKSGFTDNGVACASQCPSDYKDAVTHCQKEEWVYKKYPKTYTSKKSCPKKYKFNGSKCWKRSGWKIKYKKAYCEKGWSDKGVFCQKTKMVTSNVKTLEIEKKDKEFYTPSTFPLTSDRACPNDWSNLGFCFPDCSAYTGLENCGAMACAHNMYSCIDKVTEMSLEVALGVGEGALFVYSGGASATVDPSLKAAAKEKIKEGVKELGKDAMKEAAKGANNYLSDHLDEVTQKAIDGLLRSQGESFWQGKFNTDDYPELASEQGMRDALVDFTKELVSEVFINGGDETKPDLTEDQIVEGVADFLLDGAYEDCEAAVSGEGNVNNDIACAKAVMEKTAHLDPTGMTSIAAAFLHPQCGVEKSDYWTQ